MTSILINLLLALIAYLIGSLSTAIITCKAMGLPDPRTGGSGNPGATNVLRLGGKKAAFITLVGDLLKGTLPVLIARLITDNSAILALVGLGAFLGHLYPVYYRFKGGKGVATFLGVLLGFNISFFLLAVIVWLATALVFRFSSLAALVAAAAVVVAAIIDTQVSPTTLLITLMVVALFIKHRANIQRLLQGDEPRIGHKKASS